MVFLDSTSNLDEHNLRFFLLCTHCVAGALPLGMILTSDEQETTLVKAFHLLTRCFPEGAFYRKGDLGPEIFMTDNCEELRNRIREVWPGRLLLLCQFHILQQVWRWLFDKDHGIELDDRVEIIQVCVR